MTNLHPQSLHETRQLKTSSHGSNFFLRRPRRCSLDSAVDHHQTTKALFHSRHKQKEESCAATSMLDAFAGLQMPPVCDKNNKDQRTSSTSDENSNSSSSGPTSSENNNTPASQAPMRKRMLPHRSKSSNVLPSYRSTPPLTRSASIQDMAQQALERQTLPKEKDQAHSSLLAMSQSLHKEKYQPNSSSLLAMSQSLHSNSAQTTATPSTRWTSSRSLDRTISVSSRRSQSDRLTAEKSHQEAPITRRLPSRTASAPLVPLDAMHAPRQGRRGEPQVAASSPLSPFVEAIPPVSVVNVMHSSSSLSSSSYHHDYRSTSTRRLSSSHSAHSSRPMSSSSHHQQQERPYIYSGNSNHTSRRSRNNTNKRTSNNDTLGLEALKIEISPGVVARLRGARETFEAVENDFYRPSTCQACQSDVCCILDASYLLCPKCRSVSPVEDGNPNIAQGGIGMGFTLDELREWQADILASRSAMSVRHLTCNPPDNNHNGGTCAPPSSQEASSTPCRGGRRRSMW